LFREHEYRLLTTKIRAKIILGVFPKLLKATINFVMSVWPVFRMKQLGFQWKGFHEILYSTIFKKSVEN